MSCLHCPKFLALWQLYRALFKVTVCHLSSCCVLVADVLDLQALQRRCEWSSDSCSYLQSSFTLDWSILVGGSLNFFCISCNILFAHFQFDYLQPSKIKFRELVKPKFALVYSKSSRAALYRILKMLHHCQFCFPAVRKEEFNQMRVPGQSSKSCNTFQQWAMPVWLGTVDSTSKAFKRPNRHIFIYYHISSCQQIPPSVSKALMDNSMKVVSCTFFKVWPRPCYSCSNVCLLIDRALCPRNF